jgi:hypothetical protein
VGGHHPRRSQARHRTQRGAHDRDPREVRDDQLEGRERRDVGEPHRLQRLDAAAPARAVHQPDERDAQVAGHPLGERHLLPDRGVRRASADREVIALHDRPPTVDPPAAHDHVGGGEVGQLAILVVARAGQYAGLVEGARVDQALDALTHRQPTAVVLPGHPLGAAHAVRELLAAAQLAQLGLPAHVGSIGGVSAMLAPMADLPRIDEHAVVLRATADRTWSALQHVVSHSFSRPPASLMARVLGCQPARAGGPRLLAPGSTLPGFRVVESEPPGLLALEGEHRFSRYSLTFHLDELPDGTSRLRAETHAAFPGTAGRAYRAAVIGSRAHVLVVRRLLGAVARRAESAPSGVGGITG